LQRWKVHFPKITTDAGITTDFKPLHRNAPFRIRSNRQPLSNSTDISDLQRVKHDTPKITTDAGIMTDFKQLDSKARSPISSNIEPFSNVTNDGPCTTAKHDFSDAKAQTRV
jgi:hypothetical protein